LPAATARTLAAAVQRAFVSADAVGAAHAATPLVAGVLQQLSHWPDVCVAASTAAAVCSLSRAVTRLPWLEAADAVQWLTAVAQQLAVPTTSAVAAAPAVATAAAAGAAAAIAVPVATATSSKSTTSSSSGDVQADVAQWRVTGSADAVAALGCMAHGNERLAVSIVAQPSLRALLLSVHDSSSSFSAGTAEAAAEAAVTALCNLLALQANCEQLLSDGVLLSLTAAAAAQRLAARRASACSFNNLALHCPEQLALALKSTESSSTAAVKALVLLAGQSDAVTRRAAMTTVIALSSCSELCAALLQCGIVHAMRSAAAATATAATVTTVPATLTATTAASTATASGGDDSDDLLEQSGDTEALQRAAVAVLAEERAALELASATILANFSQHTTARTAMLQQGALVLLLSLSSSNTTTATTAAASAGAAAAVLAVKVRCAVALSNLAAAPLSATEAYSLLAAVLALTTGLTASSSGGLLCTQCCAALLRLASCTEHRATVAGSTRALTFMVEAMRSATAAAETAIALTLRLLSSEPACAAALLQAALLQDFIVVALLRGSTPAVREICAQVFANLLAHAHLRAELLAQNVLWALLKAAKDGSAVCRAVCAEVLAALSHQPEYTSTLAALAPHTVLLTLARGSSTNSSSSSSSSSGSSSSGGSDNDGSTGTAIIADFSSVRRNCARALVNLCAASAAATATAKQRTTVAVVQEEEPSATAAAGAVATKPLQPLRAGLVQVMRECLRSNDTTTVSTTAATEAVETAAAVMTAEGPQQQQLPATDATDAAAEVQQCCARALHFLAVACYTTSRDVSGDVSSATAAVIATAAATTAATTTAAASAAGMTLLRDGLVELLQECLPPDCASPAVLFDAVQCVRELAALQQCSVMMVRSGVTRWLVSTVRSCYQQYNTSTTSSSSGSSDGSSAMAVCLATALDALQLLCASAANIDTMAQEEVIDVCVELCHDTVESSSSSSSSSSAYDPMLRSMLLSLSYEARHHHRLLAAGAVQLMANTLLPRTPDVATAAQLLLALRNVSAHAPAATALCTSCLDAVMKNSHLTAVTTAAAAVAAPTLVAVPSRKVTVCVSSGSAMAAAVAAATAAAAAAAAQCADSVACILLNASCIGYNRLALASHTGAMAALLQLARLPACSHRAAVTLYALMANPDSEPTATAAGAAAALSALAATPGTEPATLSFCSVGLSFRGSNSSDDDDVQEDNAASGTTTATAIAAITGAGAAAAAAFDAGSVRALVTLVSGPAAVQARHLSAEPVPAAIRPDSASSCVQMLCKRQTPLPLPYTPHWRLYCADISTSIGGSGSSDSSGHDEVVSATTDSTAGVQQQQQQQQLPAAVACTLPPPAWSAPQAAAPAKLRSVELDTILRPFAKVSLPKKGNGGACSPCAAVTLRAPSSLEQ
jgi:trimeric autotransporter adhesin